VPQHTFYTKNSTQQLWTPTVDGTIVAAFSNVGAVISSDPSLTYTNAIGSNADFQTEELLIVLQIGTGEKICRLENLNIPYLGDRVIYAAFDLAVGYVQLMLASSI
jgi:hypothetical protein